MSTQPAIFPSHGAPPLSDDPRWTHRLAAWSPGVPHPENILAVSAHWEDAPVTLGASAAPVPVVHNS